METESASGTSTPELYEQAAQYTKLHPLGEGWWQGKCPLPGCSDADETFTIRPNPEDNSEGHVFSHEACNRSGDALFFAALMTGKPKIATELLSRELPAVRWAVPSVLPEGITLLAGKPKMGKSWLALGLCVAVAAGGNALGKVKVEQGAALYLGLEDTDRRLQKRLKQMLAGRECPSRLHYATEWRRLDESGTEDLDVWLEGNPDVRLVVIDILKAVRSRAGNGRNMYDVDYEALEPLKPLVAKHGVAILVVHHLRQMEATDPLEMISGSSGLTGAADGALILKRERGKQDATLVIDGRDIEESSELALSWDAELGSWAILGDAEEYRMSEERREIVSLLRRVGEPLGPKEISESLGRKNGAVRVMLGEMVKEGEVISRTRGKYTVPS